MSCCCGEGGDGDGGGDKGGVRGDRMGGRGCGGEDGGEDGGVGGEGVADGTPFFLFFESKRCSSALAKELYRTEPLSNDSVAPVSMHSCMNSAFAVVGSAVSDMAVGTHQSIITMPTRVPLLGRPIVTGEDVVVPVAWQVYVST